MNKKLYFEPSEVLTPIRNTYKALEEEYERIELNNRLGIKGRKAKIDAVRQRWRATVEDVRTILETNPNKEYKIHSFQSHKSIESLKNPDDMLIAA